MSEQETDLEKLKGRKDDEVKKRVQELVSQPMELKWD